MSSNVLAINSKNSYLRSESNDQVIVGIGLDNIIAVSTPDAVLVLNRNSSQEVKKVVPLLKKKTCSV